MQGTVYINYIVLYINLSCYGPAIISPSFVGQKNMPALIAS